MKKIVALILTLVLTLSLLPAMAAPAIDTLFIGTVASIESATRDEYNYDVLSASASQMALISLNADGRFEPLLADYSTQDARVWSFTIREGMQWHDGQPVTASDVAYTLQYEDTFGNGTWLKSVTDENGKTTAATFEACEISGDDRTITLTLSAANVRALSNLLVLRVMPRHIYEGREEAVTADESRVGCGPYRFAGFDKNAGAITFTAVEDHPMGTPNVKNLIYVLYNNEDTLYLALRNHEIDMIWKYSGGISAEAEALFAADDSVALLSYASTNAPAMLTFNNSKGPFADPYMREAVAYALDYDLFKSTFGSSFAAAPNRSFVPPSTVGFIATPALTRDLDRSAAMLAALGYTQKNANGYFELNGEELGFTLTVNSTKAAHVRYAEMVKNNLAEAGINVTIEALDADGYNARTSNKFSENNITMEAAIFGYTAFGMAGGAGLGSMYMDAAHAVQGGAQVSDPAFRSALSAMTSAADMDTYNAGAAALQQFYADFLPAIALYWDATVVAYNAALTGIQVDATFGIFNYNTWYSVTR